MLVSLTSVSRKEESYSPDATTEDPAEGLCDMRGTVLRVILSQSKSLAAPTFSEKQ